MHAETYAETYGYAPTGMRTIKRRAGAAVCYLPGLEVRHRAGGPRCATVAAPGCRCLRPMRQPDAACRYALADRQDSVSVELDEAARVLTREAFYPGGGTAVWRVRHRAEAACKTVRHAGQERDATGLMYYGFRYYAPWLSRWTSPDPAGTVDGLNVFAMARNNPATHRDRLGLASEDLWLAYVMFAMATLIACLLASRKGGASGSGARSDALDQPPDDDVESLAGLLRQRSAARSKAEFDRLHREVGRVIRTQRAAYTAAGMTNLPQYHAPFVDWTLAVQSGSRAIPWVLRSPVAVQAMLENRRNAGASQWELAAYAMLLPNTRLQRRASGEFDEAGGGEASHGAGATAAGSGFAPSQRRTSWLSQLGADDTDSSAPEAVPPPPGLPGLRSGMPQAPLRLALRLAFSRQYLRQGMQFSGSQHAIMGCLMGQLTDRAWIDANAHPAGRRYGAALPGWDGGNGARDDGNPGTQGGWRLLFGLRGGTVRFVRVERYPG